MGILCYPDRDLLPSKPATKLLAMLQDAGVNAKINQPYSLVLGAHLPQVTTSFVVSARSTLSSAQ